MTILNYIIIFWAIPTVITFMAIMLIAKKDQADFHRMEWIPLITACIVWPIGIFAIYCMLWDELK